MAKHQSGRQSAQQQHGMSPSGDTEGVGEDQRQRVDKWLWHARVVKTRTLAQKLVNGGKVRINREKVLAPSAPVKTGDVMTIALSSRVRVLKVVGFSERRGSATVAQALFDDLTIVPEQSGDNAGTPAAGESGDDARVAAGPVGGRDRHPEGHPGGQGVGRPSKHDRRKLADLKKIDVS